MTTRLLTLRKIPDTWRYTPAVFLLITNLWPTLVSAAAQDDDRVAPDRVGRLLDIAGPYASVGYTYDSNLFRLPGVISGVKGRSENIATVSAGFETELSVSRQQFEFGGQVFRNIYDTYDELDYTGGNALAQWNWNTSDRAEGRVGYKYNRRLRGFANQNSPVPVKDVRTENNVYADGVIHIGNQWQAELRGQAADIDFSTTKSLELRRTTLGAALNFLSRADNVIGVDARFVNGDYKTSNLRNFREYDIGPTVQWDIGGKTRLRGKVAYSKRNNKDSSKPDYDDIVARVVGVYKSGRTKLVARLYRELSNLSDEIADFAVVDGINIEPQFQLTPKLLLAALGGYEERDFQGVGIDANRKDKVYRGQLRGDWKATGLITVSLEYNKTRRSSNAPLQDYDARDVQLWVAANF